MSIDYTISGTEELKARFGKVPGAIRSNILAAITAAMIAMQARVQQKLSGEVLNNVTGRLRNSINERVVEDGAVITGSVGTNVVYARPHEYGFNGVVSVRAHVRQQSMAWGKLIKGGPITVNVREHAMHMNIPEKSFLRSTLAEQIPDIRARLERAVTAGIQA
jgi:phage gpG-like protein